MFFLITTCIGWRWILAFLKVTWQSWHFIWPHNMRWIYVLNQLKLCASSTQRPNIQKQYCVLTNSEYAVIVYYTITAYSEFLNVRPFALSLHIISIGEVRIFNSKRPVQRVIYYSEKYKERTQEIFRNVFPFLGELSEKDHKWWRRNFFRLEEMCLTIKTGINISTRK